MAFIRSRPTFGIDSRLAIVWEAMRPVVSTARQDANVTFIEAAIRYPSHFTSCTIRRRPAGAA